MITQTSSTPGKFSTYLAVTSFAIGSLFLVLHLLFRENVYIIFGGYFYVVSAVIINFLTLLYLLYLLIMYRFDRETIIIRIMILSSNIPIAFLYLNIVLHNNF